MMTLSEKAVRGAQSEKIREKDKNTLKEFDITDISIKPKH